MSERRLRDVIVEAFADPWVGVAECSGEARAFFEARAMHAAWERSTPNGWLGDWRVRIDGMRMFGEYATPAPSGSVPHEITALRAGADGRLSQFRIDGRPCGWLGCELATTRDGVRAWAMKPSGDTNLRVYVTAEGDLPGSDPDLYLDMSGLVDGSGDVVAETVFGPLHGSWYSSQRVSTALVQLSATPIGPLCLSSLRVEWLDRLAGGEVVVGPAIGPDLEPGVGADELMGMLLTLELRPEVAFPGDEPVPWSMLTDVEITVDVGGPAVAARLVDWLHEGLEYGMREPFVAPWSHVTVAFDGGTSVQVSGLDQALSAAMVVDLYSMAARFAELQDDPLELTLHGLG